MMLKFERNWTTPENRAALLLQSPEWHGRNFEHLPAQPELSSPGCTSGVNGTSMNVAFHWNGFSCAALSKTEHFVSAFEPFNKAAYLRGLPLPATNVLGHLQVQVLSHHTLSPRHLPVQRHGSHRQPYLLSPGCETHLWLNSSHQINWWWGKPLEGHSLLTEGPPPPGEAFIPRWYVSWKHYTVSLVTQQYSPLQAVQPERSSGSDMFILFDMSSWFLFKKIIIIIKEVMETYVFSIKQFEL